MAYHLNAVWLTIESRDQERERESESNEWETNESIKIRIMLNIDSFNWYSAPIFIYLSAS